MSWLYRSITQAKPGRQRGDVTTFHVGYFATEHPTGLPVEQRFVTVEIYDDREEARRAVHYLNGGDTNYQVPVGMRVPSTL